MNCARGTVPWKLVDREEVHYQVEVCITETPTGNPHVTLCSSFVFSWTHRPTGIHAESQPFPPPCPFQPMAFHEQIVSIVFTGPLSPVSKTSVISAPDCSMIPLLILKIALRIDKTNFWENLICIISYPNTLHPSHGVVCSCNSGTFLKSSSDEAKSLLLHLI